MQRRRFGREVQPSRVGEKKRPPANPGRIKPCRKCIGQRRQGELLLLAENRTHRGKIHRARDALRADVFDHIERFYNTIRRHSPIGYLSPVEFKKGGRLA